MRPWFIVSLGEHSKHASFIENYVRQYFDVSYDSDNHHQMISESKLESRETNI